ncbi:MAG: DMT family transporter [Pseudomonadota bacterium]
MSPNPGPAARDEKILPAISYMVVSCFIFASLWALIRYTSTTISAPQIVFFRSFFGLCFFAPFFIREGRRALATQHFPIHCIRGACAVTATFGIFTAVTLAPLTQVVAISYAAPIFTTIGAVLVLGEQVRLRRVMAVGIGLIGMVIVVRPSLADLNLGTFAAVLGSLGIAGSMLTIKKLSKSDDPRTIVSYSFLFVLPVAMVIAYFDWKWPTPLEWLLLIGVGMAANFGQVTLTHAFRLADASAVLPFDFVRLIFAGVLGYLLFSEVPDAFTIAGALVILTSTIYIAHRESLMAKREKQLSQGTKEAQ